MTDDAKLGRPVYSQVPIARVTARYPWRTDPGQLPRGSLISTHHLGVLVVALAVAPFYELLLHYPRGRDRATKGTAVNVPSNAFIVPLRPGPISPNSNFDCSGTARYVEWYCMTLRHSAE